MGIEVRVFVSRSAPSRRSAWTTEIPDVDITVPTILLGTGLAGLIVTAAIWIPRRRRRRRRAAEATEGQHREHHDPPVTP